MDKKNLLVAVIGVVALMAITATVRRMRDVEGPEDINVAPASSSSDALFRDVAKEAGLDFQMKFLPGEQGETFKINLYDHGCGVAVGDYNGDGHDDIYFLNQLGPNALYRNKGDGTFVDVTSEMGLALADRVCVGGTFADYDNDGDQDLYVTSTRGGNVLFRNENHQAFQDVTTQSGLDLVGHSQSSVFFDYDRDGLLDLYVAQTAEWTDATFDEQAGYYPGKSGIISSPRESNHLYHNEGGGKFVDVTQSAGLAGRGWCGDMAVFDYDGDGWIDVFVACMFGRAQLYRNQRDGTFQDVTLDVLGKTPWGGTGVKVFDFNNDGALDIYIVDMHSDMWMGLDYDNTYFEAATQAEKIKFEYSYGPSTDSPEQLAKFESELEDTLDYRHDEVLFGNAFYKNLGAGKFVEVSAETNTETFWPWGLATGDFNNDGWVDAYVTSGMGYPFYYWHNYLMINTGKGLFDDRSFSLGIEPPVGGNHLPDDIKGVKSSRSSRCAATADFDGDGRLEIVVNNFNAGPYYYRNQQQGNNYVAFKLRGTVSNRDAIGALVKIQLGDEQLVRQIHSAGGYLSCSTKTVHFGLGDHQTIDRVEVVWPNGLSQVIDPPAINALHEIIEPGTTESDPSDRNTIRPAR